MLARVGMLRVRLANRAQWLFTHHQICWWGDFGFRILSLCELLLYGVQALVLIENFADFANLNSVCGRLLPRQLWPRSGFLLDKINLVCRDVSLGQRFLDHQGIKERLYLHLMLREFILALKSLKIPGILLGHDEHVFVPQHLVIGNFFEHGIRLLLHDRQRPISDLSQLKVGVHRWALLKELWKQVPKLINLVYFFLFLPFPQFFIPYSPFKFFVFFLLLRFLNLVQEPSHALGAVGIKDLPGKFHHWAHHCHLYNCQDGYQHEERHEGCKSYVVQFELAQSDVVPLSRSHYDNVFWVFEILGSYNKHVALIRGARVWIVR